MDQTPPNIHQTGTCDCGTVTLSASGRVVSMFQCSCSNCQRASGSGHSSVVLFKSGSVTISGETKIYARPADSGATFTRHFCPLCGTTLYGHSSRAPEICIVAVGIFAGDNAWYRPNQLIFARTQAAWDLIDAHIPRHHSYRPEPSL